MKRLAYLLVFTILGLGSATAWAQKPKLIEMTISQNGEVTCTSGGPVTLELVFDMAMDQTVTPTVKYDLDDSYSLRVPLSGEWQSGIIWQGSFTVTKNVPEHDDGEYFFQVLGAQSVGGVEMDTTDGEELNKTLLIRRTAILTAADSLKFGTIKAGAIKDLRFVIKNDGCSKVRVTGLSIDSPFSVVNQGSFPRDVEGADSLVLTIRFSHSTRRSHPRKLFVFYNSNDTLKVELSGVTRGPLLVLRRRNGQIIRSDDTINFGSVEVGKTASQTVLVTDSLAQEVGLTDSLFVDTITTSDGVFSVKPTSLKVAPDSTKSVEVNFTPGQAISYNNHSATFTSNDETQPQGIRSLLLNGAGIPLPPPSEIDTLEVNWPNGRVGFINTSSFTICLPIPAAQIDSARWKFVQGTEQPPRSEVDTLNGGSARVFESGDGLCFNLPLRSLANGTWHWYLWLEGRNGTSSYRNAFYSPLTYDTAVPSLNGAINVEPSEWSGGRVGYTNRSSLQVCWNPQSDASGLREVRWKFSNGQTLPSFANDTTGTFKLNGASCVTIPLGKLVEGTPWYLYFWLVDGLGNSGYQNATLYSVPIVHDVTGPSFKFVPNVDFFAWPGGFIGYTNKDTLRFCWSNDTDPSGIAKVRWKFTRELVPPASPDDTTEFGGSKNGNDIACVTIPLRSSMHSSTQKQYWHLYFWLIDGSGNSSHSSAFHYYGANAEWSIKYDKTPPATPDSLAWSKIDTSKWFGPSLLDSLRFSPPSGTRDVARALWKFQSAPAGGLDYDSSSTLEPALGTKKQSAIIFDETVPCGEGQLYFWLADSAGNANHSNPATIGYMFDRCPPTVTRVASLSKKIATNGQAFKDTLLIKDAESGFDTASAYVLYRFGGARAYGAERPIKAKSVGAGKFTFEIPASGVTPRGVEFRTVARDSIGNEGIGPSNLSTCEIIIYAFPPYFKSEFWYALPVRVEGDGDSPVDSNGDKVPLISGEDSKAYQLISMPYVLADTSNAAKVLEDDLGPYDKTKWRLFDYLPQKSKEADRWQEGTKARKFERGRSFFVITRQPNIVLHSGPATTRRTVCPDTLTVYEGWNLIATPFNFPVHKDDVFLRYSATYDYESIALFTFEQQFNLTDVMEPWRGYAVPVYRKEGISGNRFQLIVRPVAAQGRIGKVAAPAVTLQPGEWMVRIAAKAGNAIDEHNWAGVRLAAKSGYDELEQAEPPVIGGYVSVSFEHLDWDQPFEHFATDFRPAESMDQMWEFEVATNQSRALVQLSFDFLGELPNEAEAYLLDEALGVAQNLKSNSQYAFKAGAEGAQKTLKLVVGNSSFAQDQAGKIALVPEKFELLQNYPNPFNPETSIRYNLPAASTVNVVIFDQLGRKVRMLINNVSQNAGYHSVVWDGRNEAGRPVASGIYIYKLTAGNHSFAKKMVLQK